MRNYMRKKQFKIVLLILILILPIFIPNLCSAYEILSNPKVLFVGGSGPGNYSSIQEAINDSNDGDTVYVYNGIYNETIVITKSIYLIAENKETTIIDGQQKDNTILIDAEKVTVDNFTITGGWGEGVMNSFIAGISVTRSNNIIKNNIFYNNRLGLLGLRVTNLTIYNNTFTNDGLLFYSYIVGKEERHPLKKEYFYHDIRDNLVNGKPIYYYKDQNNVIVPSDIGQLIAFNCKNLTIKNVNISKCENGIIMAYCSNCTIENCSISQTYGIWVFNSDNNIFKFNNISNNERHGIGLDFFCNNNIIKSNNITGNNYSGVIIEYYSRNNLIEKNNFINNGYNGFLLQALRNKWKCNYWDDWIGLKFKFLRWFPKIIGGRLIDTLRIVKIIPCFNFDWNPAHEPYFI